jgi:MULE transposase domain
MFTERHPGIIFIYKEQINDQQQPFVLGIVTTNMPRNALKYGDGNAVLMDATFGTNHLRMQLYTGLVMDTHGNGLPVFHVLSQRHQQEDLQEWLLAFKSFMLQHKPTWQPSCFLVDDAQAEINAIRYINATF